MDGVQAVEGFFDPETQSLIGSKCQGCGTYSFPAKSGLCGNPRCMSDQFDVAADPFVPFSIAAVELEAEGLVVLGQVVAGVANADLKVGMEMEVVTDVLYSDDEGNKLVWKFRPVEVAK